MLIKITTADILSKGIKQDFAVSQKQTVYINPDKIIDVSTSSAWDGFMVVSLVEESLYYITLEEWERIKPLLTGDAAPLAPALPADVIAAYRKVKCDADAELLFEAVSKHIPAEEESDK